MKWDPMEWARTHPLESAMLTAEHEAEEAGLALPYKVRVPPSVAQRLPAQIYNCTVIADEGVLAGITVEDATGVTLALDDKGHPR